MKELKINEVASMLRLSADSIRFYEKKGIIHPERQSDNHYRKYSMDDIRTLYDSRIFLNMGFTLAEIVEIFSDYSEEDICRHLREKRKVITEERRREEMALYKIDRLLEAAELRRQRAGRFTIGLTPELYLCAYADGGELVRGNIESPYFTQVMDNHNLFDCAVVIPERQSAEPIENQSRFGFTINAALAARYGIDLGPIAEKRPPVMAVHTVLETSGVINAQGLVPVYAWMKAHCFEPAGDILGRMAMVRHEKGQEQRVYELWVPVRED
ncbi:MerR family transcriptional regulator [Eubacterium sp. 1001713B170207_170306_E7]|uniref:MerR family transcriptional regulator n=1 Tax=Eubacterium sp. 1001713B170207_170306_E7 TaxID=2787097 RepID=UPI0018981E4A|nr:MerR family transcriptional regulator [Eubacterium sp. 1001713B170207_170306_E7]